MPQWFRISITFYDDKKFSLTRRGKRRTRALDFYVEIAEENDDPLGSVNALALELRQRLELFTLGGISNHINIGYVLIANDSVRQTPDVNADVEEVAKFTFYLKEGRGKAHMSIPTYNEIYTFNGTDKIDLLTESVFDFHRLISYTEDEGFEGIYFVINEFVGDPPDETRIQIGDVYDGIEVHKRS